MNASDTDEIFNTLSNDRLQTYVDVTKDRELALKLYIINSELSSAFRIPLEACEVSTRNAISNALTNTYSADWIHNTHFITSMPRYQQENLTKAVSKFGKGVTTSKVIPELNFSFWQSLLTKRFERSVWNNQFNLVFKNTDKKIPISTKRKELHQDLEDIRKFRNRIAHYEPIFNKDTKNIYNKIISTISKSSLVYANLINEQCKHSKIFSGNIFKELLTQDQLKRYDHAEKFLKNSLCDNPDLLSVKLKLMEDKLIDIIQGDIELPKAPEDKGINK